MEGLDSSSSGELTVPPEMINLSASSTEILRGVTSSLGTNNRNPDVGFGVVGTKTLIKSLLRLSCTTPPLLVVVIAIECNPGRGY